MVCRMRRGSPFPPKKPNKLSVAQTLSFTQAARRLGLRQSTVSQHVRKLEEVTGVACAIISTGSDRAETIVKNGSLVESWLG